MAKHAKVDKLIDLVDKRVLESKKEEESTKIKASYLKILLTYTDRIDMALIFFGYLFAIITGVLSPSWVII